MKPRQRRTLPKCDPVIAAADKPQQKMLPASSVIELLRSGRMSDSVILLEDEVFDANDSFLQPDLGPAVHALAGRVAAADGKKSNESSEAEEKNSEDDDVKCLMLENATRVALLITRSFANCQLSLNGELQLRHFFIKSKEEDMQRIKPGFFSKFHAKKDFYPNALAEAENPRRGGAANRHLSEGKTSESSTLSENEKNAGEEFVDSGESLLSVQPSTNARRRYEGLPRRILLGIVNLTPAAWHLQDKKQQGCASEEIFLILGKLLYSVFSFGKPIPSDLLPSTHFDREKSSTIEYASMLDGDHDDPTSRSFQKLRTAEISIFSRLIGSRDNNFPVSICRLLSDIMADDQPSLLSFQDVTQDLEQMISRPQIFLHDSYNSPHSTEEPYRSEMFGQKYYGRKEEISILMDVANQMKQSSSNNYKHSQHPQHGGINAVFISGIAGSGKSNLVHGVAETLSNSGWIVAKAKFIRGMEHASRMVISSLFDQLVIYLLKMKESEKPSDVAYSHRACKSILDAIGYHGLHMLVGFLPSISSLFDGFLIGGDDERTRQQQQHQPDRSFLGWHLINSLSKIVEVTLESHQAEAPRFIMLCCDDMQWSDKTSMALISEVLIHVGGIKSMSRHLLFVGAYRSVCDNHPFTIQYSYLQMSSSVNATEIKLHNLSNEAVVDIISTEFRLARRLVVELADVVHKRTSGHAYFVVELLNSLLSNSTITYDTQKQRYDWDLDRLDAIQTWESVAGLIAANLSYLPIAHQRVLKIISSFGTQIDLPLLKILEKFDEGILNSLDMLIERGILDRAGTIVIFCHDLIHQEVCESMPLVQRQLLHLEIGEFLGSMIDVDGSFALEPVTHGIDQIHFNDQSFFAGRSMTSSLVSLACDQFNRAGPVSVCDESQQQKIAQWNLSSGKESSNKSDFRAALYYFSNGYLFLGECWSDDTNGLCQKLCEGAVFASFSLSEADNVTRYANQVIENVKFEESLEVWRILLSFLTIEGKHSLCVEEGTSILRRLGFQVPTSTTIGAAMMTMKSTNRIASNYNLDQITNLCEKVIGNSAHNAFKVMDAVWISCYATQFPLALLITCEIVKLSLAHGISHEALQGFACFGMLQIIFNQDYAGGRYWADVTRALIKKLEPVNKKARLSLLLTIDIWYTSARDISRSLLDCSHDAAKLGQVDIAMLSLRQSWRFKLFGGENLSMILQSSGDRIRLMAKHSKNAKRHAILDNILLLELTGEKCDASYCNTKGLLAEAKLSNDDFLLYTINVYDMLLHYWRGNYSIAEEYSQLALSYAVGKMPQIILIYFSFFRGLIAFSLYRKTGDWCNGKRLKEGKQAMEDFGKWTQNSDAIFSNKFFLLKAEYLASIRDNHGAEQMYKASMKAALDHGNIHELALAYELFGHYHSAHERGVESIDCFKNAHMYYSQWGATAIADKVSRNHNLMIHSTVSIELQTKNSKHPREWTC